MLLVRIQTSKGFGYRWWGIDQNTHKGLLLINTESFDIYFTEYGTDLITILPILFLYLNTVIVTAGDFEP